MCSMMFEILFLSASFIFVLGCTPVKLWPSCLLLEMKWHWCFPSWLLCMRYFCICSNLFLKTDMNSLPLIITVLKRLLASQLNKNQERLLCTLTIRKAMLGFPDQDQDSMNLTCSQSGSMLWLRAHQSITYSRPERKNMEELKMVICLSKQYIASSFSFYNFCFILVVALL